MNSKKGFAHLILLIILFLAIVGIGYWAYKNGQIKFTSQQSVSPTPTQSLSETTNWKTYRSDIYKFQIKYPSDWQVWENDISYYPETKFWLRINKNIENRPWTNSLDYPWFENPNYPASGLEIIITKDKTSNFNGLPIINLEKEGYNCNFEYEGCVFLFKYTKTIFAGIPALLVEAEFPDIPNDPVLQANFGNDNIRPYSFIAFERGNSFWFIVYDHADFNGNHNPIYNQILSTFKFINKNSEMESYVACGCGCCGGSPAKEECLYRSKGDNLERIIEEDQKNKYSSQCSLMGCSLGIKFKYCD